MPEFTDEQIAKMIEDAKADATKGYFTQEELDKKVQSEVDRRVESGIQKGLETAKTKWEDDFTKKQNMSAEEIAAQKLKELQGELSEKEKVVLKKSNTLTAKEMLAEAGVPKAQYEKLLDVLVSDNEEATKTNVAGFIDVFNNTKSELETNLRAELSKVPPIKQNPNGGNEIVTKTEFDKMGYADKLKFKVDNPEKYKEFMTT